MQFRLTYQEISDLIARKAGRSVPVMYGGPHTVNIAGFNLTVDEVDGEGNIYLSYDAGMGMGFVIRMALNHAKSQPGGDMFDLLPDNRIVLNLGKMSQRAVASQMDGQSVGSLFDHIRLLDISFDEEFVIVDFEPKI